jgi:hypothetical protein
MAVGIDRPTLARRDSFVNHVGCLADHSRSVSCSLGSSTVQSLFRSSSVLARNRSTGIRTAWQRTPALAHDNEFFPGIIDESILSG